MASAYPKMGRCLERLRRPASGLPPAHLPWFWDTVAHRLLGCPGGAAAKAYALAPQGGAGARAARRPGLAPGQRAALRGARSPAGERTERASALAGRAAGTRGGTRGVRARADRLGGLPGDLPRRPRPPDRGVRAGRRPLGTDGTPGSSDTSSAPPAARRYRTPCWRPPPGRWATIRKVPEVQAALLDLFPDSRKDAAAWLRLLLRGGIVDAAAAGHLDPEGGLAGWLGRYTRTYRHQKVAYGGVASQPMPAELFEIVTRFAPRPRAAGTPVVIHEDKYRWPALDADLLDACLAEGIEVTDPGDAVRLTFWDDRSRRDLKALAAHPVFGRRLEGTVHERLRGTGTAITRLPENAGIAAEVHTRIEGLLGALRGGGLAAADEAVTELSDLLDRPTAVALDGIEEALAGLDLTGPLASRPARRVLGGAGLARRWTRPSKRPTRPTPSASPASRPVLTVFGGGRGGRRPRGHPRGLLLRGAGRGDLARRPLRRRAVLVSWRTGDRNSSADQAYWVDRPDEVFIPGDGFGLRPYGGLIQGGFGYQFETPDRGGRFDGQRVLRPGGREGIGGHEFQMSDGRRFFGARVFHTRGNWTP
ncbi:hypothetical protein LT493_02485 [Streptomyces tricolor]|nr:hypothetical protein [Streptomyces tricolor]